MALSSEQIEKLRRIYKETTNDLARKTAKEKLEAAGVSLEEKPEKKEKAEKKTEPKSVKVKAEKKDEQKVEKPIADCEELQEREEKAANNGYDINELLKSAKERKARAKEAAEKRKNEPKKTPATKNKEAVEKTTEKVTSNVQHRAEKGDVGKAEIEKLIAEYKQAIEKLEAILKGLDTKKKAKGGNLKGDISFERKSCQFAHGGTIDWKGKGETQDTQKGVLKVWNTNYPFTVMSSCNPSTGIKNFKVNWTENTPNDKRDFEEDIADIALERHYKRGGKTGR